MPRPLLVAAALIVALAGSLAFWFSPTQVVKRRVLAMIRTASVPESMPEIARASRGRNLSDYLAPTVRLAGPEHVDEIPQGGIDRSQIAAAYTAAAGMCRFISLEDVEFESIDVLGDSAEVRFTVDAIVQLPSSRPLDGIQHVELQWSKTDDGWRLTRASWTESGR